MSQESCRTFERLLVEYADGELDAEKSALVESHLRSCAECTRAVDEYRQSLNVVREGLAESPQGQPVVLASIERRVERRRRRRRLAFALSACVAVACICLILSIATQLEHGHVPANSAATTPHDELAALTERIAELERQVTEFREEHAAQDTSEPDVLDLAEVDHEEVAAICVAAGMSLEEKYGNVEAALERYRYAVQYFAETAAAKRAQKRIEELTNRAI